MFLGFHNLREFCSFYTPRTFSRCCSLPFEVATHYGAPHTPRKGMHAFVSLKKDPKHSVPWFPRFARVLLVLHSRTFSRCCSLPFDLATHYGAPHTHTKGMDVFVLLSKDPKHKIPWFSCFTLVFLVLHYEDLFTLLFASFQRGHTLWCSPHSEEGNACIRFIEKGSET